MRTNQRYRPYASWRCLILLAGLALLCWSGRGQARVEADANKSYAVTAADGAWLICVTSYSGEQAGKLAHDLVLELRGTYGLPAFVFNRGAEEREKQNKELEERRRAQKEFLEKMGLKPDQPLRLPRVRVEEQYAVLVGGYKDIDTARRALDSVKKLEPPRTVPLDSVGIVGLDPADKDKKRGVRQRADVNPFKTSFVVRNPSVAVERPAQGPDTFLKELNADEKYSLLTCRKRWTLVVKDFLGASTIQPQAAPTTLLDKLLGRNCGDMLVAGAKQAHEVARALRDMNFEAYVLHMRHGSIVTVGGYDSPEDPQLLQNQRVLANLQMGVAIKFFNQPLPMEVPRFDR